MSVQVLHELVLANDDELMMSINSQVYETVVNWMGQDFENRKQYFPTLLEHVRLNLLPAEFLLNTVSHLSC